MQASVRILCVVTGGVALALVLVASTPAALAYNGPTPQLIKAYYPLVNFSSGSASYEDGPVELPHPVDPSPGSFSAAPAASSMTPTAGTGGKVGSASPANGTMESATISGGALPGGRSAGPIVDGATRAEKSIRQVIRKLG